MVDSVMMMMPRRDVQLRQCFLITMSNSAAVLFLLWLEHNLIVFQPRITFLYQMCVTFMWCESYDDGDDR